MGCGIAWKARVAPYSLAIWKEPRMLEPLAAVFFLFQCWETRMGQEMYKLLIFDLLSGLAVALLVQFPRK